MKKTILCAGIISLITACNNHAYHDSAVNDTGIHISHNQDINNNSNSIMKATMDKMMHEMHVTKPTGNNDIDFASMMIAHHKGAVNMSQAELTQGSNNELKAFAQKVIDDQNREISFMQDFIARSSKGPSPDAAAFQKALNRSMEAMMKDTTKIYDQADLDFAAQMIPHHQSAVNMAEAYLEFGKDEQLNDLCQSIISSQSKEIEWLKKWLKENLE